MSCSVYIVDIEAKRRYHVGNLYQHTDMSRWLRERGEIEMIYEIWKGGSVHSRWCWKEKKERWGKMQTPVKKHNIDDNK